MATITTDVFLDGGTARTAGETWRMNGGTLTIRTDTRWHSNAPASYLGSIGAVTIDPSLGGGIVLDGTDVRWLPISGGSGVPAIGDTVIQGAVSGYYLGFWASLSAQPVTTIGSTGFIKFREVLGGSISAGPLTFPAAGAADATGPDVTGWIEVVQDQSVTNTIPRLGSFVTRGDWFYLDNTTGLSGQQIQTPNMGGLNTYTPGVWVETASASETYEFFTANLSAVNITTNFGIDARSKVVEAMSNGVIKIGSNGAKNNSCGYTPPSGCRVRIPNVIGRQTAAANRAINYIPNATIANRPDFTTTASGLIDCEYFISDWYLLFGSPYIVSLKHCSTFDVMANISNASGPFIIDDCGNGTYLNSTALTIAACGLGGSISNSVFRRADSGAGAYAGSFSTSSDIILSNSSFGVLAYARNAAAYTAYINQCLNMSFTNCATYNHGIYFNTSFASTVTNHNHIDRFTGATNTTTGIYAIYIYNSSDGITVNGVNFGLNGAIANVHPYAGIFNAQNSSNLIFKNVGTAASPINAGASNQVGYIYVDGGVNTNVKVQRCYLTATRTAIFLSLNSSNRLLVENCVGTAGAVATAALNATVRSVRNASNSTTGQAAVYGTHNFSMFTTNASGVLWVGYNEPTTTSSPYVSTVFGVGAGFTAAGDAAMPNVGDMVQIETPYYVKGFTSFLSSAPIYTGTNTGNFNYTYAIDTSGSYSSYKTLNQFNLSAEPITPNNGFKLKIKSTCVTPFSTNKLTYVSLPMFTTLTAQNDNLYFLIPTDINVNGLTPNSRIQLYNTTSNTELYNGIATLSSFTYTADYSTDFDCRFRVMYQSGTAANMFMEFTEPITINGLNKTVTPTIDTVYSSNAVDGSLVAGVTINDTSLLVNVSAGVMPWPDIYAYETYWLYTEQGIRDEGRFIEAVDTANYKIYGFKIKNASSPSIPIQLTKGWAVDGTTGKSIDIIDTTGGTLFSAPDHVVPYAVGGSSGATAAEVWGYSTRKLSGTKQSLDDLNDISVNNILADSRTLTTGKFIALK